MFKPKANSVIVSTIAMLCLGVVLLTSCKPTSPDSQEILQRRQAEILSVQPYFRMPVPDNSGEHLAFIHAIGVGRRLFICDLNTLKLQVVPASNDISHVYGWSPNDRFLAFGQTPPSVPWTDDSSPPAWVTIFDTESGKLQRVGTNVNIVEGSATWLSDYELFFSRHAPDTDTTGKFIFDITTQKVRAVSNYVNNFVLIKTNTCAFFNNGNIQSCLLDTTDYPPITDLTDFGTNTFDQMRWLQYRSEDSSFLFCARRTNSNWRCLYEYDLRTHQLKQLTKRGTYNGQYLGAGFAYVGNTNNEMYLSLNPVDSRLATNLFKGGNVVTYAASRDGDHVYAVASEHTEPPGLWDYIVSERRLRQLVGGQPQPWKTASLVLPQARWIKSFDGLIIPYFVVPPVELSNHPKSARKFPVVLYLPPATWQFQRAFDLPAQFYANMNCWYLAVNYRGGDGYGKQFSQYNSAVDAAHDALVVLTKMGQNTNVDLGRVVLSSESSGAQEALILLKEYPQKWRGAMLHHLSVGVEDASSLPTETPPLLVVIGALDDTTPRVKQFVEAANDNGFQVELHIQKDTGHEVVSADQIKDTMLEEFKFFQKITR